MRMSRTASICHYRRLKVTEIRWSRAAERAAFRLPAHARAELLSVVDYLQGQPRIGRVISEGRYRGLRQITIGRYWLLYYQLRDDDRVCELRVIRDGRRPV